MQVPHFTESSPSNDMLQQAEQSPVAVAVKAVVLLTGVMSERKHLREYLKETIESMALLTSHTAHVSLMYELPMQMHSCCIFR